MKGWTELCSDVNWQDYHGMWARKAPDGSWYVLKWTNIYDAGGEEEAKANGWPQYECDVKRIDFQSLPKSELESALECVGWSLRTDDNGYRTVVNDYNEAIVGDGRDIEPILVQACIDYGLGAPLETFTGDKYPLRIRAQARRYAESLMRDEGTLRKRLQRTVNKIGSTAEEYGKGDIESALHRGPFDTGKNLMRKMHGLPKVDE
jgi:hypothetical protein